MLVLAIWGVICMLFNYHHMTDISLVLVMLTFPRFLGVAAAYLTSDNIAYIASSTPFFSGGAIAWYPFCAIIGPLPRNAPTSPGISVANPST